MKQNNEISPLPFKKKDFLCTISTINSDVFILAQLTKHPLLKNLYPGLFPPRQIVVPRVPHEIIIISLSAPNRGDSSRFGIVTWCPRQPPHPHIPQPPSQRSLKIFTKQRNYFRYPFEKLPGLCRCAAYTLPPLNCSAQTMESFASLLLNGLETLEIPHPLVCITICRPVGGIRSVRITDWWI